MYGIGVWYIVGIAFVYGTIFSSFVTLVAYRVPIGVSVNHPPSHCSRCKHRLGVIDLIPILGSLIARFRCRYCGVEYGKFHAILELVVGLLFSIIAYFAVGNLLLMGMLFLVVLIANLNIVSWLIYSKFFTKTSSIVLVVFLVVLSLIECS